MKPASQSKPGRTIRGAGSDTTGSSEGSVLFKKTFTFIWMQIYEFMQNYFSSCRLYWSQRSRNSSASTKWLSYKVGLPKNNGSIPDKWFFLHSFQTGSGAHPATYPMRAVGLSAGGRRRGRETDIFPPPSAEVKYKWSNTSIPLHTIMVQSLTERTGGQFFVTFSI
jgi:hypothetical protein